MLGGDTGAPPATAGRRHPTHLGKYHSCTTRRRRMLNFCLLLTVKPLNWSRNVWSKLSINAQFALESLRGACPICNEHSANAYICRKVWSSWRKRCREG